MPHAVHLHSLFFEGYDAPRALHLSIRRQRQMGIRDRGQLAVYYNPERTRQWASLPAGTWRKVSDGVHAGVTPFGPCFRDALELAPTSVTVLVAE